MPIASAHANLTDAAIIAASRRDPARFAQIFDRHWPRIHRYCVSRAGSAGEDIAAETFRIALDRRRSFDRSREDAAPWLFGIASNLLRRSLRSETRRTRALARLHPGEEPDLVDGAATTGVPIQERDGSSSATAFEVERVTAAHLPAEISASARLR